MKTGIYLIQNKLNGKCYVGQAIDIEKRWKRHKRESKNPKMYISRAIAKYGEENFDFSVLEECSANELDEKEISWIEKLDTYNNGYNCTIGGDGHNEGKNCYSAEYKRAYYEENKENLNAYSKAYYEANREKLNAAHKAWNESHKDDQEFKEKRKKRKKAWYEAHKLKPTKDFTDMPLW